MNDAEARVRRRCNRTAAAIMDVVDGLDLPKTKRRAIRRQVMAAVHAQGDDTVALIQGVIDRDATFPESWLTDVGFGFEPPDPTMHDRLVVPSETGDHGNERPPTG